MLYASPVPVVLRRISYASVRSVGKQAPLTRQLSSKTSSRLAQLVHNRGHCGVRGVQQSFSAQGLISFGAFRLPCANISTSVARRAQHSQPFILADIGEGIQEVEIIKFMAKEGDKVEEFDPICEVQSDKATVEITSRFAGTITKLTHKVGDIVKVGSPLCFIRKEGDTPSEEPVASEESASSPAEGQEIHGKEASVSTGEEHAGAPSKSNDSQSAPTAGFAPTRSGEDILATPAVRRLSRDHGVQLGDIQGNGKDGRITKEDVLRYIENKQNGQGDQSASEADRPSQVNAAASSHVESQSLDSIRRAMFKAMAATLQVPHFAYSEEIDVTALEELRKNISTSLKTSKDTQNAGLQKITMLPLLVKALSLALRDHPLFLSTLSLPTSNGSGAEGLAQQANGAKLVRRNTHDISIALSTPQGLLTPLLRSVESKSITDLAFQIVDLQTRAVAPKGSPGLTPSDFGSGGTITLSNIGAVGGGTYTHPLLPPTGQLAIGALGRTRALPRFASECPQDGLGEISTPWTAAPASDPNRVVKRLIMPVSFTGDHRVVEGAELARLVNRWKTLVEQPSLWFTLLK
ncbi:hypothetical protein OC846_003545 [Tilletia horrida]|uniref:Dihydrolipoamide acetyltransferase component of pyruvate dehydrogenase complex n=1 Tax=Tilletia horrida TaxID=155126 RepID=A0AAN6GRU1_9BASI|nr:hypothetical protein OC846_003545 [Tilletia horrida]KAK0565925.1 hypothetical protein OC861_003513 [Tilletia horrida]